MLASSVAACACSHHSIKVEAAEPSCHSGSHESMPTTGNESVESDAPIIDGSCNCYVNVPTPVVASGKAQRVAKIEKESANPPHENEVVTVEFRVATRASIVVEAEPPFYLSVLRRAGPSRAPPRL